MARVHQVFSLADDLARYVKACGKQSVLETKLLSTKINTKELGYISPNGNIIFQSADTAQKYAKDRIVRALTSKNPHERGLFVDRNVVLEEVNGDRYSVDISKTKVFNQRNCDFDKEIDIDETVEFIHGHPDFFGKGRSAPLSAGDGYTLPSDYAVMIGNNLKKVTAYNSLGKYNSITWLGNKSKIEAFQKHSADFWNYLAKLLDKDDYSYYKDVVNRLQKCFEQNGAISKELMEENQAISLKILEKAKKFLESEKGVKIYHKLWQKNAAEYGVSYSTNFSNLV